MSNGGLASTGGTLLIIGSGGDTGTGGTTTTTGGTTSTLDASTGDSSTGPVSVLVDNCPGSLDATTVQQLQGGGSGSGARLLYPYDDTVFPVGLLAPVFQWEQTSGTADAVYVHLKSTYFEYKGCFGPSANFRQAIPETVWQSAGEQTQGSQDPLTVEITVKSGSSILSPMTEQLIFARGKLKGDIFYNTYTSPLASNNGAVMKLRLGNSAPEPLLKETPNPLVVGPCWSCHSLSANGAVLVAQHHQYNYLPPGGPYSSASFDLVANTGLQPPAMVTLASSAGEMGLGAVYPDGSMVLTMGSPGDSTNATTNPWFPDYPGNIPAMLGPKTTMLLDTKTGQQLPLSGWNVQYAKMPSFSPDGKMVVFNWHEDSNGHSLAVADFDAASKVMSNVRVIYKDTTLYPGWPWITPDNKEVVFVLGNAQDYVSTYPGRLTMASSDLWTVDIATGAARKLNRANGYPAAGGTSYLPKLPRDEHLQFFPTMSPIAAGGYFWVFFTSRRTYGNTIVQDSIDATTKKIWVSAYSITDGTPLGDPSHPPFYLPGQEAASGNIRAFAALEPCHQDGDSCETGVDCCIGFCTDGKCGMPPPPPPPKPGDPPPPVCAKIDERCTTKADCCDTSAQCINGFCGIPEIFH